MNMKEKAAYIKGLAEGLDIDAGKPEGKIIKALVEMAESMAAEVEIIKENVDILSDYIEEIDEDLGAVEEFIYDEDDLDCCDCDDDCDCDCDCDCDDDCDCCDGEFYCAMCPSCGEKIYFDESCDPAEVVCPACQKPLVADEDGADKAE